MTIHVKEKISNLYEVMDRKFFEQFGFRMKETTFLNIVEYLHAPKDPSSLAVTRILFGLAMLFDIPDERGGAIMDRRWGSDKCHFPLLPFITALPMPYMAVVYLALWIGALGITLGYKYRITSVMFTVCYWYLFLIEKSYWNNHSYLFGLVALLLSCTQAHCFWSIDAKLNQTEAKGTIPYWNYFILKYQFFILYFMAGMKKGTAEWLTGYSVQKLSEHWVFDPFKLFLTVPQIDYLIVHWFIFLFDLTVAIWMMWERTRNVAMIFCAMFHLMNSRLFRIGMFPWICLATMPLFYPFDWPKTALQYLYEQSTKIKLAVSTYCSVANDYNNFYDFENDREFNNNEFGTNDDSENNNEDATEDYNPETTPPSDETQNETIKVDNNDKNTITETIYAETHNSKDIKKLKLFHKREENKKLITCVIFLYVITQAFLPYSHFITKGYNNWTNGLYGYSWDMMVHTWDTQSVIVKIKDNFNNQEHFIDHSVYTPNDRWTRHGDMVYQLAHCLNRKLSHETAKQPGLDISVNVSIYIEVWCSMNGRFTQRLFDSKVDLLRTSWSPFEKISYLMPLLDEAIHWRSILEEITKEVHTWNNESDVIFLADFPNYEQEQYVSVEMRNVTLSVLEGIIAFETESTSLRPGKSYKLSIGNSTRVDSGLFHKVQVIGDTPAYYMYTFTNTTETISAGNKVKPKLPILTELYVRFKGMVIFFASVIKSLYKILYGCSGNC